jgi:hypothetical protein
MVPRIVLVTQVFVRELAPFVNAPSLYGESPFLEFLAYYANKQLVKYKQDKVRLTAFCFCFLLCRRLSLGFRFLAGRFPLCLSLATLAAASPLHLSLPECVQKPRTKPKNSWLPKALTQGADVACIPCKVLALLVLLRHPAPSGCPLCLPHIASLLCTASSLHSWR